MKKISKGVIYLSLSLIMLFGLCASVNITYASATAEQLNVKASVLIDIDTGTELFSKNADERMPVASIVKLMTIMLTFENIDKGVISLDDKVVVSSNASGMGGSQIFLDAECEYNLGQLLKSVIVCSANDSSVAIAEHISGNETNFVELMNKRAKEMGLSNTNYVNCTGLPASNQYSCAIDVAKVLKNVLKYEKYHEYSSVWLEDFKHPSGRVTQMTNTNRLTKFYQGCIGGKTGSTQEAGYCLAVGAKRGNLGLISVVLGASSTKERFKSASDLLNYGFANYENYTVEVDDLVNIYTKYGKKLDVKIDGLNTILIKKGEVPNYETRCYLPNIIASCDLGQELGYIEILIDGKIFSKLIINANEEIKAPGFIDNLKDIYKDFI